MMVVQPEGFNMNQCPASFSAILCVIILGGSLSLTGCTEKPLRKLYPTEGTVTFQGAPVAGAEVVFDCPATAVTLPAITDANGKYVTKMAEGDGLPEGEYTVFVKVRQPLQVNPREKNPVEVRKDIPSKYARGILKFKVEAVKKNTFDIQLEP
jgi:hypothetical protein